MLANVLALVATVILMVFMGYFMLGSLPLLVLEHDTPLDSSFIRNFFNLYYKLVLPTSIAAAVAYAVARHPFFSAGMAGLAVVLFLARRVVLTGMDALRATMTPQDTAAIARFRRLHVWGMALNAVLLLTVAVSLTLLKL